MAAAYSIAGKARVHELAKELGVTSKEILAQLADQGELVKSASSTVEAPVARRLRAIYANKQPSRNQRRVHEDGRTRVTTHDRPRAGADRKAPPREQLTGSQAATVRKAYREAYVAENHSDAINKLYLKYEALYGVSRTTLREVIAVDRQRHAADYAALRSLHNNVHQAKQQQKHQKQHTTGKALGVSVRESTVKPPHVSVGTSTRPRNRLASLPSVAAVISPEAIADIILSKDASQSDREEVVACLQPFDPTGIDGYGGSLTLSGQSA